MDSIDFVEIIGNGLAYTLTGFAVILAVGAGLFAVVALLLHIIREAPLWIIPIAVGLVLSYIVGRLVIER